MAKSKRMYKQTSEGMSHRVFDDMIDLASTLFRNRKAAGADRLRSLADATRDYAASMTDLPTLQRQAHLASENIGNFAEYVLNTDIKHMVSDVTVLAKRRPLLTLGVAAAAGLAVTHLATTSSQPSSYKTRGQRTKKSKQKSKQPSAVARRTMNGSAHAHT
ncbi:MAG TPA: hypothetical protein VIJ49_04030 [Aestuariivirga sp.]